MNFREYLINESNDDLAHQMFKSMIDVVELNINNYNTEETAEILQKIVSFVKSDINDSDFQKFAINKVKALGDNLGITLNESYRYIEELEEGSINDFFEKLGLKTMLKFVQLTLKVKKHLTDPKKIMPEVRAFYKDLLETPNSRKVAKEFRLWCEKNGLDIARF